MTYKAWFMGKILSNVDINALTIPSERKFVVDRAEEMAEISCAKCQVGDYDEVDQIVKVNGHITHETKVKPL